MKPSRLHSLAMEDEARDDEILRRHGSHADDGDAAPRERSALARTRPRGAQEDDAPRAASRHGRAEGRRAGSRR